MRKIVLLILLSVFYIGVFAQDNPMVFNGFTKYTFDNPVEIDGSITITGLIINASTEIVSISTGLANNDKMVTQGYVDDADDFSFNATNISQVEFYVGSNTIKGSFGHDHNQYALVSNAVVPAALTKFDDTNITLTLGGTPTTSLIQPVSLTLGWTGILSIARGGTNSSAALGNSKVMVSSAGTIIESATITITELGLLNGIIGVSTGVGNNDKFVTQGYVDDADNVSLWEVDGTETQLITADEIDMQTKKIINLADPILNQDAVTKKYADDAISKSVLTTVYEIANYTATATDNIIIYTTTAIGDKTVTLPDLFSGKGLWVRQGDQTNNVIISASGLTIDGVTNIDTYTITGTINSVYCVQSGTGAGYQWNIVMIGG